MSNFHKEHQELRERNIALEEEVRSLHQKVRKWSTWCAYASGSSIGVLLFLLFFSSIKEECPEPIECDVCEVCEPCAECEECPKIDTDSARFIQEQLENIDDRPQQNQVASSTARSEYSFPMSYTIQSGDNFSKIADRFYKKASLAKWLAKENNVDPSKLQIGQEITLPAPPQ